MKNSKFLFIIIVLFIITILTPVYSYENNKTIQNGIEKINDNLSNVFISETILEETHDIISSYNLDNSHEYFDSESFLLNENIIYKFLNIPYYFLKDEQNFKKRIFTFNQGRTYVINNQVQEITKEKIIELKLNISDNTNEIYLVIDHSQSTSIPNMSKFINAQSTIEIKELPTYIKINKTNFKNSLFFTLNPNILNLSLQIIELDDTKKISGVYSTNILQLDNDSFNKYTLFQMNKNILEYFCPYCEIEDFGINENGFSSCGRSIFEVEKKSILDYLKVKENVCLTSDGQKIAGFTNESLHLFGLDRLYFEWNNNIPSDFFDYGQYYVDEDQLRIAVSKKLNAINNKEFITINNIKYKKGKNNLISKVGTYIELDLIDVTKNISNKDINDALNKSIIALESIPEEYKLLTILDLINTEPIISESEFEKYILDNLVLDYYKVKDYHNHFQINLKNYILFLNNLKEHKKIQDNKFSIFLYSLESVLRGYSNIYFSEGLDYFIYNVKPFYDLNYSKKILTNEYTKMFGDFWMLNLVDTQEFIQPTTVVVNIKNVLKKEADISFLLPSENLYVNFYLDNFYFTYNYFFLESINALSYNRGLFFENTSSVYESLPYVNKYEDIQNGSLFSLDFDNKNYVVKNTTPIIITKKNFSDDITIKYYNGKEYIIYPKNLLTVDNSSDVMDYYSVIIYPQNTLLDYPIIIESSTPLYFNVVFSEQQINNKYVYKLNFDTKQKKLLDLMNSIQNGNMCFSISENNFSIWKNLDKKLQFTKTKHYNNFNYNFTNETLDNYNLIYEKSNLDDNNSYDKQIQTVNKFLDSEIKIKNLEIYTNYKKAYDELLLQSPNLKKDFTNLFDCKDTLICNVSKISYTPSTSFFEKFKNVCVKNTPTECVSYWSNPKINYCAAFVRVFSDNFFNNKYDSANAWDLSKQSNNISVWKAINGSFPKTMYDYLIPGSILGIKQNNTSYIDKEYSHVVVYLGKKGSKHYVIHSWGSTLKIEQLDVFLKTTARGKNAFGYFEDGEIKEILISKNFYLKLKEVANDNGIFLGKIDSSIYDGKIPDYILDSFYTYSNDYSEFQQSIINNMMYNDLKKAYIYFLDEHLNNNNDKQIKFNSEDLILIILNKYKSAFLINKEEEKIKVYAKFPISTGLNGFGCEINDLKTPTGLFKISQKIGKDCSFLQIITNNNCLYDNGNPIFASLNSETPYIVNKKLVLENVNSVCNLENNFSIYGTNLENLIGLQNTNGNIRMLNEDIVLLYDILPIGSYVYIYNDNINYFSLLELETSLTKNGNNFEHSLINYYDPLFYGKKEKEQFLPNIYIKPFVLPPDIDLRTEKQKIIDSLEKGIDNCYTTNETTLNILRSKNLNLEQKNNVKKNLDSIVVPSNFSLSYEDILKIASPRLDEYQAHQKFITAIPTLYNLCAIYNIDPIFVLAKFYNERSMYNLLAGNYNNGELVRSNNPTGIKRINGCACNGKQYLRGEYCEYPTLDAGFEATLLNLINTKEYNNKTLRDVAKIWAEDPNYGSKLLDKINIFYRLIE